ncbi:MAG: ankyrin repeat domain-containing protein [Candidatus Dependentiae bacterium]|nr:ankyrin repeat domain-containing protein [Candidatus Dependentiae bacterium]
MSLLIQKVMLFLCLVTFYRVSYAAAEQPEDATTKLALLPPKKKNKLLCEAVCRGDTTRVDALLGKKADIDAHGNNGYSPIHLAAIQPTRRMTACLIKHKANINQLSNREYTPILLASMRGHCDVVTCLLQHNADINARVKKNDTPFHCASVMGYHKTLTLLLEYEYEQLIGKSIDANKQKQKSNECQKLRFTASHLEHLPLDIIKIIIEYKGLDQPLASLSQENDKQETALTHTHNNVALEHDNTRQVRLKKCIAILEQWPHTIICKLIQHIF